MILIHTHTSPTIFLVMGSSNYGTGQDSWVEKVVCQVGVLYGIEVRPGQHHTPYMNISLLRFDLYSSPICRQIYKQHITHSPNIMLYTTTL